MKKYEVEQKFHVADLQAVGLGLDELGVEWQASVEQVDRYFDHPARSFAETDEALRLRAVGDKNRMTYKGPKIDSETKTRREIEINLPAGPDSPAGLAEILLALGFTQSLEVRKSRRVGHLDWRGAKFEIALDDVAGLGTFVEIELSATESELDAARNHLFELSRELNLDGVERRSYLELLIARQEGG